MVAVDHNTHVHMEAVTLLGQVVAVAAVPEYMAKALVVRLLRQVHFKVVMVALAAVMVPLVVTLLVHGPVVLVETTVAVAVVAALTTVALIGAAAVMAQENPALFVLSGVLAVFAALRRSHQPMLPLLNFL